tara:strand:- start:66 stop:374 length:309 start_codon:yes stop_codon:yes gene_type:complete
MTNLLTVQGVIKVVVWLVPILFAMGIFYAQTEEAIAKAGEVEGAFRAHEKLQDHPVAEEKIKKLEAQGDEVLREQKTLRKHMRRANENISAICQAIPGARCK